MTPTPTDLGPPTAAQAMVAATHRLRAAGVPDPARDARVLLAHAAQIDASRVTLIAPEDLDPEISERYDQLVSLRAIRVPASSSVAASVDVISALPAIAVSAVRRA